MAQREVTLPSGLRLKMRGLKVNDFGILSDEELAASNRTQSALLEACTVETLDWGPYKSDDFDWQLALLGDQMTAMIEARICTHGPTFDFDVTCPSCGERIRWSIDLTKLERRAYSADAVEAFKRGLRGGPPMSVKVEDVELGLRAVTVEVAHAAARALAERRRAIKEAKRDAKRKGKRGTHAHVEKMNALLEGLVARVVHINGDADPEKIRAWLGNMELGDLTNLRRVSDDHDGGIETSTLVRCSDEDCGVQTEIELPLDLKQFWLAAT